MHGNLQVHPDPRKRECQKPKVSRVLIFSLNANAYCTNLAKISNVVLEHPTCSPDLAMCDFILFPTTNNHLKGSHRETMKEIQEVTPAVLNGMQ